MWSWIKQCKIIKFWPVKKFPVSIINYLMFGGKSTLKLIINLQEYRNFKYCYQWKSKYDVTIFIRNLNVWWRKLDKVVHKKAKEIVATLNVNYYNICFKIKLFRCLSLIEDWNSNKTRPCEEIIWIWRECEKSQNGNPIRARIMQMPGVITVFKMMDEFRYVITTLSWRERKNDPGEWMTMH